MAKTQGPHHLPDSPRAQAIALRDQGYSTPYIAGVVGVPQRTVWDWCQRALEATRGNKAVYMDRWTRNVLQAQDLTADALDLIQEDDTRQLALKNLANLNIIAGTGTDKLQRESSPPTGQQNVLIIVRADRPVEAADTTIEGELA